jgi:glycosyltransferase involved in cell wall biosynthesis
LIAAVELKRKGVECLIRIAGNGPLHQSLLQQAQDLQVADRVVFLGHREDIPTLLADSTFLVHTAENEGCPNAVMEAMACGRAVVATDAGDVPLLIANGNTGFVVQRDDPISLAERIQRLITDSDLCRSMGEAARAKAEKEFGLNRLVEKTLEAYRAAGWKDGY